MTRLPAALLAAAIYAIAAPAHANFFKNGTGLASPGQTVDFESVVLATNQVVTTEFQSLGVTFTGAFANPDPLVPYPNVSGNRISNFQSNIGHSALFVADFGSTLSEVAFSFVSSPGTATFEALLNGILVESGSGVTSAIDSNNFFGFTGITFNQIRLSVNSFDSAFVIDNLQTVNSVPEPESWALLLMGVSLIGVASRRDKR